MSFIDSGYVAILLAAWLLTYAVHSSLFLGLTALWVRLRPVSAAMEQALWRTALLGSLATATLVVAGYDGGALGARVRLAPPPPISAEVWPGSPVPALATGLPEAGAHLSPRGTGIVLALWALTAAWGLLRLRGARRRLARELGPRRRIISGPLCERFTAVQLRAGTPRRVRLTVARDLGAPIAIGRDEICVPERALRDLEPAELEGALAHELGHLERGDPAWKGFAAGLSAVFFFQPLLTLARKRLAETAEFLADDWALRHTGAGLPLARCLARVASWGAPGLEVVAASGMASGDSPFVRRVERILGRRPAEPAGWRVGLAAAAILAVVWGAAPGVVALAPRGQIPVPAAPVVLVSVSSAPESGTPAPALAPAPSGSVPPSAPFRPLLQKGAPRPHRVVVVVPSTPGARVAPRAHRRLRGQWRDENTAPAPRSGLRAEHRLEALLQGRGPLTVQDLERLAVRRDRVARRQAEQQGLLEEIDRRFQEEMLLFQLQELERLRLEAEGTLVPLPVLPSAPVVVRL